jgi:hypothetical protein
MLLPDADSSTIVDDLSGPCILCLDSDKSLSVSQTATTWKTRRRQSGRRLHVSEGGQISDAFGREFFTLTAEKCFIVTSSEIPDFTYNADLYTTSEGTRRTTKCM